MVRLRDFARIVWLIQLLLVATYLSLYLPEMTHLTAIVSDALHPDDRIADDFMLTRSLMLQLLAMA